MAPVAEWLVGRVAAPAERDHGSACEAEHGARGIDDLEIAFNAVSAVVETRDFGGSHQERVAGNKTKSQRLIGWRARVIGRHYPISAGQWIGLVSVRSLELETGKPGERPGLPLEARKEDLAYGPLAGKDPVVLWPAYGAHRLDP